MHFEVPHFEVLYFEVLYFEVLYFELLYFELLYFELPIAAKLVDKLSLQIELYLFVGPRG